MKFRLFTFSLDLIKMTVVDTDFKAAFRKSLFSTKKSKRNGKVLCKLNSTLNEYVNGFSNGLC